MDNLELVRDSNTLNVRISFEEFLDFSKKGLVPLFYYLVNSRGACEPM